MDFKVKFIMKYVFINIFEVQIKNAKIIMHYLYIPK